MKVSDYIDQQIDSQAEIAYNSARVSLRKATWPSWENLSEFHKNEWRRRMRREI